MKNKLEKRVTVDHLSLVNKQKEEFDKDKIRYIIDTEKTKTYVLYNILQISITQNHKQFDGFPLVLVFFEIVSRVLNIIKPRKYDIRTRKQQHDLKLANSHEQIFNHVCETYFDCNVYKCYNELIYLVLMSFVSTWHTGLTKLQEQVEYTYGQVLTWRKHNSSKTTKKNLIFLFQNLYSNPVNTKGQKKCHYLSEYQKIIDNVFNFVMTNLSRMVTIRQNQNSIEELEDKTSSMMDVMLSFNKKFANSL